MRRPTTQDTARAIAFVKSRVDAELAAAQGARALILQAAYDIVSLAYQYHANATRFQFSLYPTLEARVNRIISNLQNDLMFLMEQYSTAVAEDDEESEMGTYFSKYSQEVGLADKLERYTDRFRKEMEMYLTAAAVIGIDASKLKKHISQTIDMPYNSTLIRASSKKGVVPSPIDTNVMPGQYKASMSLISRIERGVVAMMWMYWDYMWMSSTGAIGFIQYRGSSYPCSICDAATGFHPIEELDSPLPHVHCKCYRVPIYQ